MQKILGLIFMAAGAFGMAAYLGKGMFITADEKIAMLLGFFLMLVGFIIIYADWEKESDKHHERKTDDS